ncbi:hypothetical protein J2X69_001217 [Algoriphagus sp. 4150]|uniref:M12 family metallo-peptidase n=1 Tax=Algoriphagus sp. 4150 TaxID=2817756 RepID=UPI002859CBDC|nr:M12 family metallo-peptidase [Algoriphagus sp. 4150]MDR7128885.1 hypothetical protein [Algoriphagus sp. 4150]
MKNIFIVLFMLACFLPLKSQAQQNLIFDQVLTAKNNGVKFINEAELFSKSDPARELLNQFKKSDEVEFFILNKNLGSELGEAIEITLPIKSNNIQLELLRVPDSFYEYNVTLSNGTQGKSNESIKHYRGIVKGNANSIAAISIYENEVIGIVSTDEGNFNVSLDKKSGKHIFFNERNLIEKIDFSCETNEGVERIKPYSADILTFPSKNDINSSENCVRLYFETEYDVFQTLGNAFAVEFFVASLFNQVATLYQNENINTSISNIFIWNSTDPYTSNTAGFLLTQFQNNRTSFDGDLGQLLTFRDVGGGYAAGIGGLCSSNVSNRLSVSGIFNSVGTIPIYSWSVSVVTHEFGHLLGSRHTHACVWNGNNTAIDGCASPENLQCPRPSIPSAGGTIMSYCHFTNVGVNFNLGFGIQPGNVIRNTVANASCLCQCGNSSIVGPNFLCSTSSFSLQNPPAGNSVTWSVSPTNLFSGNTSGNGNSANLNINSGSRGLAILTYTILTSCGNVEVKKSFWVGKASLDIIGPYDIQFNTAQNYFTQGSFPYVLHTGLMGVSNYQWAVYPSGYEWIGGNGSSGISLSISHTGVYSLSLDVTNPCGVIGSETSIYVSDYSTSFNIYPNPTSEIVTVKNTVADDINKLKDSSDIFEVSLFNERGQILLKEQKGDKEVNLNVKDLDNGLYYVHISYKGMIIKRAIFKR